MAKQYTKETWVDEVLAGAATYNISGTGAGQSITLDQTVTQAGTDVDAAVMQNIEDMLDLLDDYLYEAESEITVSSGTLTLTKTRHKAQPESGTTDDINTLAGATSDTFGVIRASDNGTDTLTFKHGVDNISCFGGSDIDLSEGIVIWYYNGSTYFLAGGGSGGGGGTWGSITGTLTSQSDLMYMIRNMPDGTMINGKISPSVASNNLTVAIKTLAGNDPSSGEPVYVKINGTWRSITAALSVTKNAGTNWFNAGSTELATQEIDYFVYIIWNTGPGTDIADIGVSRVPFGKVYSEFSSTTTDPYYLAYGNGTSPAATDDLVVVGRFAATLSAAAGHTWTVPSYTSVNLVQHPIYESRVLTWQPVFSAGGSMTWTSVTTYMAQYQIIGRKCLVEVSLLGTTGGTASANLYYTLPFPNNYTYNASFAGAASDSGNFGGVLTVLASDSANDWRMYVTRYDVANFGLGAGRGTGGGCTYTIG